MAYGGKITNHNRYAPPVRVSDPAVSRVITDIYNALNSVSTVGATDAQRTSRSGGGASAGTTIISTDIEIESAIIFSGTFAPAATQTTPTVAEIFFLDLSGTTVTVTSFDDGIEGQLIRVETGASCTLDHGGGNLALPAELDYEGVGHFLFIFDGTDWQCLSATSIKALTSGSLEQTGEGIFQIVRAGAQPVLQGLRNDTTAGANAPFLSLRGGDLNTNGEQQGLILVRRHGSAAGGEVALVASPASTTLAVATTHPRLLVDGPNAHVEVKAAGFMVGSPSTSPSSGQAAIAGHVYAELGLNVGSATGAGTGEVKCSDVIAANAAATSADEMASVDSNGKLIASGKEAGDVVTAASALTTNLVILAAASRGIKHAGAAVPTNLSGATSYSNDELRDKIIEVIDALSP